MRPQYLGYLPRLNKDLCISVSPVLEVCKSTKDFQLNEHTVIGSQNEQRKRLADEVALFQVSTPAASVVIQPRRSFV